MTKTLMFRRANKSIGYMMREAIDGPERDLVKSFVAKYIAQIQENRSLALFYEPRLETGFPDLVVVEYRPEVFRKWATPRFGLALLDMKLLQFLHAMPGVDVRTVTKKTGMAGGTLLLAIERLLASGMIEWRRGGWRPLPRQSVYGVRMISAFEAKVNGWHRVMLQAEANRWFASRSYVISGAEKPGTHTLARARETGIGLYTLCGGTLTAVCGARREAGVMSYVSWLFNEWIGRRLQADDVGD
jgi:hypothetical protein